MSTSVLSFHKKRFYSSNQKEENMRGEGGEESRSTVAKTDDKGHRKMRVSW